MTNETDGQRFGAEAELSALLADSRAEQPGPDLTARVLSEAHRVQMARASASARAGPQSRSRPLKERQIGLPGALGGWAGLGGVTAAGVIGLLIGLSAPETVGTFGAGQLPFLAPDGSTLIPDLSALALESDDV